MHAFSWHSSAYAEVSIAALAVKVAVRSAPEVGEKHVGTCHGRADHAAVLTNDDKDEEIRQSRTGAELTSLIRWAKASSRIKRLLLSQRRKRACSNPSTVKAAENRVW